MTMNSSKTGTFHAVMFPWFAMGHLTPYIHLSNKLAERGHRVSYLVPTKTMSKLESLNLYPHLISFVPLDVPHVDGLPLGTETTNDVTISKSHLILDVFDRVQSHVEALIRDIKPDFVFFDLAPWIPSLTRSLGIKSVMHSTTGSTAIAYFLVPSRMNSPNSMTSPPLGFPPSSPLRVHLHELRKMSSSNESEERVEDKNHGLKLVMRTMESFKQCDLISFRAYKEIEGSYCDYVASQYDKPVLLTGPTLPPLITTQPLEEQWANWLGKFKQSSVLYCSFGSECVLIKDQFQELLLGLEMTGMPFLVALKPPHGSVTVEEALPNGFAERVKERGIVHGGWVQQPQILAHPSVGCFVSHCGYGSMWESLLINDFQIVLVPNFGDQFLNSRLLSQELKVAVEVVKREEDGCFSKENVCNAVRIVMDEGSKIGVELKANHVKLRKLLSDKAIEDSCLDTFTNKLLTMLLKPDRTGPTV